jgi:galactokinase
MAEHLTLVVRAATAGDGGCLAAEANHETVRRRQKRLDEAFETLKGLVQQS